MFDEPSVSCERQRCWLLRTVWINVNALVQSAELTVLHPLSLGLHSLPLLNGGLLLLPFAVPLSLCGRHGQLKLLALHLQDLPAALSRLNRLLQVRLLTERTNCSVRIQSKTGSRDEEQAEITDLTNMSLSCFRRSFSFLAASCSRWAASFSRCSVWFRRSVSFLVKSDSESCFRSCCTEDWAESRRPRASWHGNWTRERCVYTATCSETALFWGMNLISVFL